MQSHFIYRDAALTDVEQLRQLGLIAYGQYGNELTPENLEKLKSNIGKDDTWKNILAVSKGFVCLLNNKVVGMAFLTPHGNPWDIFKAEWCYIRMVGVNPACQVNGIAKALTKMCIDYAKETNEKTIALHTSEMMGAARHIYESFGFKILLEIEPRYGKKYWLYTLSLQ